MPFYQNISLICMNPNSETILMKCYDLLKFSIPIINRFNRNYKFTFGDRMQNLQNDLLEQLIEAFYASKAQKQEKLSQVNLTLEKLRFYYRLGNELGVYKSGLHKEFAGRIDEIGRMCGGWIKSLK